jgi:hypothetical protein
VLFDDDDIALFRCALAKYSVRGSTDAREALAAAIADNPS